MLRWPTAFASRPEWTLVRKIVSTLHVRAISPQARRGVLQAGHVQVACCLGRGGRSLLKREGDGASPAGLWRLGTAFYRPDRWRRPATLLPAAAMGHRFGWCDAPGDRNYNRPVTLPYAASHEAMWRDDCLYDVVVTLDHNARPRIRNRGSAVFLHLANPQRGPTAGCVAIAARDMRIILALCGPRTRLAIWPVRP